MTNELSKLLKRQRLHARLVSQEISMSTFLGLKLCTFLGISRRFRLTLSDMPVTVRSATPDLRVALANLGSPKTGNRGLDLAQGRLIAMLDSDDVATPDRLRRQGDFLKHNRDHALAGSNKYGLGSRPPLARPKSWRKPRPEDLASAET